MTLLELVERCKAASGPNQELDTAIAMAVQKPSELLYTASLEAAMTLVPDRYYPGISQNIHQEYWFSWIGKLIDGEPTNMSSAQAATAPLAMCAAALQLTRKTSAL